MRVPAAQRSLPMGRAFAAAWTQLRAYPTRMVAVVLAIVLGVGFVAATLVFGSTYRAGLGAALSARYVPTDVVVTNNGGADLPQILRETQEAPGVELAQAQPTSWLEFSSEAARGVIRLDTIPDDPLRWFDLVTGSWPSADDQVLIDEVTAASTSLHIGSVLTVTGFDGNAGQPTGREVTVVGIADTASSAFSGAQNQAFAAGALISELDPSSSYGPVVAIASPGITAEQLRDSVAAAVPADVTVLTAAQQIDQRLAEITGGAVVLTIVLLGFAVIAVVASGIVIANTFTILLTQRRRHIALTRCIGASRGQVRREVLAEAGLVGAIGSVLGVAVGIGIGALGARVVGLDAAGPVVPLVPLVLTGVGGIVITTLAAYAPASRAMRIAPLAALRPVSDATDERRLSALRLVVAGSLTGLGVLLMAWAVSIPSLLVAMGGGALSACGILLLTRSYLPAVLRVVGGLGGAFGPPGKLAAANAARNPGRAAATTAALMLGVGLIVTMQVGAASAQTSLDRSIAQRYPVDVSVTGSGGPIAPRISDAVTSTDGIRATGPVTGIVVESMGRTGSGSAPGSSSGSTGSTDGRTGSEWADPASESLGEDLTLLGVSDAAAGTLAAVPAGLADDSVIVPSYLLASGLSVGERITLRTAGGSATFTVASGALAEQGINGDALVTTTAAVQRLTQDAPVVAVWAAIDPGADPETVTAALNQLIAGEPDLALGGSAPERAALSSALGTIVTLATALLAVAVIIAIVGIGNTLGLSVIERTRESALLRALGLHRRQLRAMLAVEAALLGAVGAAVGVLAGIGYGWVGAASAFGEAGEDVVLDIPWSQLGVVLLLAVAAALLASVVPARRAAMATPTQALADL